MEVQTVNEGNEKSAKLTIESPLRLEVEAEVIRYISKYIEDCVPGHPENDYHIFVVERIGERYGQWYESICRSEMTEDRFRELYLGKSFQTLAHFTGVKYPLEYLRNLVEAFTVSSANGAVGSTLAEIGRKVAAIRDDI